MRQINSCLNTQLVKICQKTIEIEKLTSTLARFLPAELLPYCQVASFTLGRLVLSTTDAVWAMQLRYLLPQLRDDLRSKAHFYQLTSIKVNLDVAPPLTHQPARQIRTLSPKAQETLKIASDNVPYLPLKMALLRLSRT